MIGALLAKRNTRAAYQALNHHNLDRFLKDWHEDAIFDYPGDIKMSGTHTGKPAIRQWFQTFLYQFPTIEFKVKHVAVNNLMDVLGNMVIITEWHLRLINKNGFSTENHGVTVSTSKKGKVVHAKDYLFNSGDLLHKAWEM